MSRLIRSLENALQFMGDVLPFFGDLLNLLPSTQISLLVGIAVIAGIVSKLWWDKRHFHRQLSKAKELGEQDENLEPVLKFSFQSKWYRWHFNLWSARSIQLDREGVKIEYRKRDSELLWQDIKRWRRDGLAEWVLWGKEEALKISVTNFGLTEEELIRIDRRLTFHVAGLPQATWRTKFQHHIE